MRHANTSTYLLVETSIFMVVYSDEFNIDIHGLQSVSILMNATSSFVYSGRNRECGFMTTSNHLMYTKNEIPE